MEEIPTLYTERLILRPLELADADAVQQQFAHWEVVRYLNALVPWPYPPTAPSPTCATLHCRRWPLARSGIGRCG